MVKKVVALSIMFIFINCIGYRTEFGKKRYKIDVSKIKENTDISIYKILDTTKLYEAISAFSIVDNRNVFDLKKTYLKFYAKGRVGVFYQFGINDINSLNPKRADMGYFNYANDKLLLQIYFENPQTASYIKVENTIKKINNNFLELHESDYIYRYKIIDLPKEFLIYKPDW